METIPVEKEQPLLRALTTLEVLMGNHPLVSGALFKAVVEALGERLAPSFIYLFAPDKSDSTVLVPVPHLAQGQTQPPPNVRLRPGQADLLSCALTEDAEVFIETAQNAIYKERLPAWVNAITPTQLLLLPIVSDGYPLAFILLGNVDDRPLRLTSGLLRQLKAVRLQLATALRLAEE